MSKSIIKFLAYYSLRQQLLPYIPTFFHRAPRYHEILTRIFLCEETPPCHFYCFIIYYCAAERSEIFVQQNSERTCLMRFWDTFSITVKCDRFAPVHLYGYERPSLKPFAIVLSQTCNSNQIPSSNIYITVLANYLVITAEEKEKIIINKSQN